METESWMIGFCRISACRFHSMQVDECQALVPPRALAVNAKVVLSRSFSIDR